MCRTLLRPIARVHRVDDVPSRRRRCTVRLNSATWRSVKWIFHGSPSHFHPFRKENHLKIISFLLCNSQVLQQLLAFGADVGARAGDWTPAEIAEVPFHVKEKNVRRMASKRSVAS